MKDLWSKLKLWAIKTYGRKVVGIDVSESGDFGAEVTGYYLNGDLYITGIKYTEKKEKAGEG